MRMLRSVYNRGVESGRAPYVPRLFHDVYTGVDIRQKCQIGKGHPAELEHQSGNGLCTSQTVRLGILIQKLSLRRYGQHLSDCGLKPNTVSTYMRMLRSVYNRGVKLLKEKRAFL